MSLLSRHIIKLIILVDIVLAVCILAEQKLARVDAALYTAIAQRNAAGPATAVQLQNGTSPAHTGKTMHRELRRHYPSVFLLNWEPDTREDLTAYPLPRIQELATIIHCLATKAGVGYLGISTPLIWEDSRDEMSRQMLARALRDCRITALGIPSRNAAQTEVTPEQLQQAIIPRHLIEGDPAGLPYANAPLPYVSPLTERDALLWAPDYVEDAPRSNETTLGLSCPLLLRWKGDILPTLPLRLALACRGLTPADVQVRLGKSIRIGGRLLPLDAHGRTPLGAARVENVQLADVLSAPTTEPQNGPPAAAILARPFTPDQNAQHGNRLAATLSLLLSTEREFYIPTEQQITTLQLQQNPLQNALIGRILIVALIICALIWLPLLPRREQIAALAGLALASIIAGIIGYHHGIWLSISAWALGWLALAISVIILSRSFKQKNN